MSDTAWELAGFVAVRLGLLVGVAVLVWVVVSEIRYRWRR